MEKEKKINLLKDIKALSLIGMCIFPFTSLMLFLGLAIYDETNKYYNAYLPLALVTLGIAIAFAVTFFVIKGVLKKQTD